ncbi:hypothetical protein ONA91_35375 [Micromonospora sp. DR5-3]|nr:MULTISPECIES: hypothetical protein [unclassified Micromonospora]MCW3819730.1 hypothetical protein [Micromonospora sp. DR5-3]
MGSVYQIGEFAKWVGRSLSTFAGQLSGLRRYEKELQGADLTMESDR